MKTSIFDYKIGQVVDVMSFGKPDKMEVIGHDTNSNQVKLRVIGYQGSSYFSPEKIKEHKLRVKEYSLSC